MPVHMCHSSYFGGQDRKFEPRLYNLARPDVKMRNKKSWKCDSMVEHSWVPPTSDGQRERDYTNEGQNTEVLVRQIYRFAHAWQGRRQSLWFRVPWGEWERELTALNPGSSYAHSHWEEQTLLSQRISDPFFQCTFHFIFNEKPQAPCSFSGPVPAVTSDILK